jgi:hypothetical protein
VSRLRLERPNAPPPSHDGSWADRRGISRTLELAGRSRDDSTRVQRAPINDGKAVWSRSWWSKGIGRSTGTGGTRQPGDGTPATWATEISSGVGVRSRSDQRDDFPLSFGVSLDVSGGRSEAGVAGKLLDIAEAAADFADFACGAGDEAAPTRMRRAADHAEIGIESMEPHDDGSGRQTFVSFAMDDWPIGASFLATITM